MIKKKGEDKLNTMYSGLKKIDQWQIIEVARCFERWNEKKCRLKIAFGGRGGVKSWSLARLLVIKSFLEENKGCVFLIARETLSSIEDSSYALIKDIINEFELDEGFEITKTTITNVITDVKFRFAGVREYGIKRLKSIHDIKYCYIDEAEDLSIGSWLILEPSVRGKDSEIWVSFNPNQATDFSYSLVKPYLPKLVKRITGTGDKRGGHRCGLWYEEYDDETELYVLKTGFYSSPFKNEALEKSRLQMQKDFPEMYNHVWLGEIKPTIGKIFASKQLRFYDYDLYCKDIEPHYEKRAIIDPAFGQENCFTSCVIYQRVGEDFYIVDAGLLRTDANNTTDEALDKFLRKYDIKEVMCEANFHQKELAKKLNRSFKVIPFYQRVNKIERIVDASLAIRSHVLFDKQSLIPPEGRDTDEWLLSREGRNYIGMMQLLNFSDVRSENCKKDDDLSYIDFVDVLASLVKYSKVKKDNVKLDVVDLNKEPSYISNQRSTTSRRLAFGNRI